MIEGPTLVAEALAAGVELTEAFVVVGEHGELAARVAATGAPLREVAAETLARSVDAVTPQGIAAIARRPDVGLDEVVAAAAAGPLTLVLVDVNDPGNAGTLLRAAEASGAAAVVFCGSSVDPFHPKCVRGSAGSLFHIPVASEREAKPVLQALRTVGVSMAATVVRGGTPYHDAELTGPIALVLGSEAHGLPQDLLDDVDLHLSIPMTGRSESLNVAMAGSVIAFEAQRQRRTVRR